MEVSITGPKILFTLPFLGGINITESVVNSWIALRVLAALCVWLTRGMTVRNPGKRQIIAEKLVTMANSLVEGNMGENWSFMTPFIATVLAFSFTCSVMSVTGLRSPTADFSVTMSMALVTFGLIQFYQLKFKGFFGYLKHFTEPIWVMTPMNLVSEAATPLSMALRHFGNVASGTVITALVYRALAGLSRMVLGWISGGFISGIPILQVGLPAILSIYFDLFSSAIQAYIFCMLTMANIAGTSD